jgi:hypothetical protein
VPLHQSCDIKLGLLNHLHLANKTILDGENSGSLTLDLLPRCSSNERLDKGLQISLPGQGGHCIDHLTTDGTDLRRLSITSLLELIILLLREGYTEHADNVSVRSTGINIRLNNTLLLLDERAELVTRHVHTVKVEEAVEPLHILYTKLDLAVGHGLVVVEVGKGEFDDASLKSIRGNFLSLGFGDDGLAAILDGEDGGGDELVPFFFEEGVDCLLLAALFGLGESRVLYQWWLEREELD